MKGNRQGMINEFYMNQDGYSDPTAGYALQKLYREQLQEMRRKELEAKEKERKKAKGKKTRKRSGVQDAGKGTGTYSFDSGQKETSGSVKAETTRTGKKPRPEVQVARYPDRKRAEESRRKSNAHKGDRSEHRIAGTSWKGGIRHD